MNSRITHGAGRLIMSGLLVSLCLFSPFATGGNSALALRTTGRDTVHELNRMVTEAFQAANALRAASGIAPLKWDTGLAQDAIIRTKEISMVFSHTRPNGSEWYTLDEARMWGENMLEADMDTGGSAVVGLWNQSDVHRAVLLEGTYHSVGIAAYRRADGRVFWVMEAGY